MVLAAGWSKRMGTKKEILPIAGEPMIRKVVSTILDSPTVDEVIVVLGYRANDVGGELVGITDERVELVGNVRFSEGLGTSLAQGARACSWRTDAILVFLADAPFFTAGDISALVEAHAGGAGIAVPVHGGRRGHPVLLDGTYRDALEGLAGDAGARHLIEKESEHVVEVELPDDAFLVDIDERVDYEAVRDGI